MRDIFENEQSKTWYEYEESLLRDLPLTGGMNMDNSPYFGRGCGPDHPEMRAILMKDLCLFLVVFFGLCTLMMWL